MQINITWGFNCTEHSGVTNWILTHWANLLYYIPPKALYFMNGSTSNDYWNKIWQCDSWDFPMLPTNAELLLIYGRFMEDKGNTPHNCWLQNKLRNYCKNKGAQWSLKCALVRLELRKWPYVSMHNRYLSSGKKSCFRLHFYPWAMFTRLCNFSFVTQFLFPSISSVAWRICSLMRRRQGVGEDADVSCRTERSTSGSVSSVLICHKLSHG